MWKRFWTDLSKAMMMTDPMAYGLYLAWSLEGRAQGQRNVAWRRADSREAPGFTLAQSHGPSPVSAEVG